MVKGEREHTTNVRSGKKTWKEGSTKRSCVKSIHTHTAVQMDGICWAFHWICTVRCTQRNFLSLESVQNMHILRKAHDDDADTYTHLCNTHRSIVSVCVCIEMTTLQYTKSILLSLSYTVCHCVRVFMSYCGADFFYSHRMYLNFLFTFAYWNFERLF